MREAFLTCLLVEPAQDNSKSSEVSATLCWQKQQMRDNYTDERRNSRLIRLDSHRPRRLGEMNTPVKWPHPWLQT